VTHVSAHIYHQVASAHVSRDLGYLRLIRDEPPTTDLLCKVGAPKLKLNTFGQMGQGILQQFVEHSQVH
jgi:hypothetical protein